MPPLDIIVCIKPVPDPKRWKKLELDPETMLLRRTAIPAVMNQLDRHAVEQAVLLKESRGASISVLTMAPPSADEQLVEALAMGCDRAYLVCDKAAAGADTLATARVLAAAVRRIGTFDLVFCGAYSQDGSTSSVGPQLAELLGVPEVTYAVGLEIEGGTLRARCKVEDGEAAYEADLPALVTFDRQVNVPRPPTMTGIMRAQQADTVCWSTADLGLRPETVGLAGSPTQMLNVFKPAVGRKGEILKGSTNDVVSALVSRLQADGALANLNRTE
ncbi:MAG: electron transfer flavoprotein subunit beta/FixA family protein [Acidobacteria bacterium]|nr:MAG: electron transfer flavoprotein subunit beta/FixA family protein [Acidobacteriota bacterium]